MRTELIEALRLRVERAAGLRDRSSSMRAAEGDPPLGIVTCLGPGRCLIPGSETKPVACPFCVRYQGPTKGLEEHIKQVVQGN
jgi:hypothetical protein